MWEAKDIKGVKIKMKVEAFVNVLDTDFYTGVPDSQLKALCNYLIATYGIDKNHHIIAASEGNCTALAAGYHLSLIHISFRLILERLKINIKHRNFTTKN